MGLFLLILLSLCCSFRLIVDLDLAMKSSTTFHPSLSVAQSHFFRFAAAWETSKCVALYILQPSNERCQLHIQTMYYPCSFSRFDRANPSTRRPSLPQIRNNQRHISKRSARLRWREISVLAAVRAAPASHSEREMSSSMLWLYRHRSGHRQLELCIYRSREIR